MSQIAWAAYNKVPPGMEPGLEAVSYYDPPNMTYPFGAYICVMDIDVDTGVHKVRRFYALDDCGTRINPMIIEGQVHGGCTEGFAIAMGQEIAYDEDGNVKGASFMDYFLPTAVETPHWETDYTVTPSPHHPIGAKGVGESPNVGSVPCFANAVNDAFKFCGLDPHRHAARRLSDLAERRSDFGTAHAMSAWQDAPLERARQDAVAESDMPARRADAQRGSPRSATSPTATSRPRCG